MYKLQQLEMYGKYSGLIYSFLSKQHQRLVLNGYPSCYHKLKPLFCKVQLKLNKIKLNKIKLNKLKNSPYTS